MEYKSGETTDKEDKKWRVSSGQIAAQNGVCNNIQLYHYIFMKHCRSSCCILVASV